MWTKAENGEPVAPAEIERSGGRVILRRRFALVPDTKEFPAHYTWEEWQMTEDQYEIYQNFETLVNEQSDALIELAELITEAM